MHIPDGFLDAKVWVTLDVVSAGTLAYSAKRASREMGESQAPLMGVMGAFLFAAQMINFPIGGGTSGHLLGATLATVLLGPWAAALVMGCVLAMQALLFADGGILAWGANCFNMGLVGCLVAALICRVTSGGRARWMGVAIAAWLSVVIGSALTAVELSISGTVPLKLALPAMVAVHGLIGIGEALITVAALSLVAQVRPDLLVMGGLWRAAAKGDGQP
jgi:cobalt/nickel transport system permease protein